MKRGSLIVFEGLDRTGKTTQSRLLFESLKKTRKVKLTSFPNRQTQIGQLINSYLTDKEVVYSNEFIHLLFSINRWECIKEIEEDLLKGISVIIDRYSYSGIAFSVAKGLNNVWCTMTEKGLLKPDIIFYFTGDVYQIAQRSRYGNERYETINMQLSVKEAYEQIMACDESLWNVIDANKSINDVKIHIENIILDLKICEQIKRL